MGDEQQKGPVEYDSSRSPLWGAVVDSWAWQPRDRETVIKVDLCPRCGHQMSVIDEASIHARMVTIPGASPRRYAECNCGVAHPGAPDGVEGCGANGLISHA